MVRSVEEARTFCESCFPSGRLAERLSMRMGELSQSSTRSFLLAVRMSVFMWFDPHRRLRSFLSARVSRLLS